MPWPTGLLKNAGLKNGEASGGDGGFGTSGLGDDDSPAESANEARSLANSWQAASERRDLSSGLCTGGPCYRIGYHHDI